MLYIITEDENSARDFWNYAASVYRSPGTYTLVPLITNGGNTTLKAQVDKLFQTIKTGDELFLVIDNIAKVHNFWAYDFINKTSVRCERKGVRFTYTKYYCFEEVYLSYSELVHMTKSKYIEVLEYVNQCLNDGTEYFDKSNMDERIVNFLNSIHHPITNKEHFADDLLVYTTQIIMGKFKIHKSGNVFDSNGMCWLHDCAEVHKTLHPKQKDSLCSVCEFKCRGFTMKQKFEHLGNHSIIGSKCSFL